MMRMGRVRYTVRLMLVLVGAVGIIRGAWVITNRRSAALLVAARAGRPAGAGVTRIVSIIVGGLLRSSRPLTHFENRYSTRSTESSTHGDQPNPLQVIQSPGGRGPGKAGLRPTPAQNRPTGRRSEHG